MQKGAWKEAGREDEDEVQFYSAPGYMSHFVGLELLYSFRVSNHKFPHQSLGSCGIILSQHSPPPPQWPNCSHYPGRSIPLACRCLSRCLPS